MRFLIVLCVSMLFCGAMAAKNNHAEEKVKIAVYYESLCPDSKSFITQQLAPVWNTLRDVIKVKLVPYGKSKHEKVNETSWQFECHHGPEECYGNKVQACVLKNIHLKDTEKMDMIICLMNQASPDKALEKCLNQTKLQAEFRRLRSCVSGQQGDFLLAFYGEKTDAIQKPLDFVPTVVINEEFKKSIHDEAIVDLKGLVCRVAPHKPKICT